MGRSFLLFGRRQVDLYPEAGPLLEGRGRDIVNGPKPRPVLVR
jgi:hypothetical protein